MSAYEYDRDVAVALARELIAVLDEWFPARLATADSLTLAAGYVARSRSLLSGMATLVDAKEDASVGNLYRTLLESYFSGVYALLGGEPAVEALRAADDYESHSIKIALGQSTKEEKPAEAKQLPFSRWKPRDGLVQRVSDLLRDEGRGDWADWALDAYRYGYKVASRHFAHGGLASLDGYLAAEDDGVVVATNPDHSGVAMHMLHLGIGLTLALAGVCGGRLGWDTTGLSEFDHRWRARPGPAQDQ